MGNKKGRCHEDSTLLGHGTMPANVAAYPGVGAVHIACTGT